MTMTLSLPPEIVHRLQAHADALGRPVNELVVEAIEEKLRAAAPPSLEKACAPLAAAVAASGMDDEAVRDFMMEVLEEARAERRGELQS